MPTTNELAWAHGQVEGEQRVRSCRPPLQQPQHRRRTQILPGDGQRGGERGQQIRAQPPPDIVKQVKG